MKTLLFLLLTSLTFGQEFIVLTEGQAQLIKNRYGIYSELDPIMAKDDTYILPTDCLNDIDLVNVKKWLEKLPTKTLTVNDFKEETLLPRFTYVTVGQTASLTANIPESVNLANLSFVWGRRTVSAYEWAYRYDPDGNVIDSLYRPKTWNNWTVITGRTTQTITSPSITNAYLWNKIGVRITHIPTGRVFEDYTILRAE